MMNTSTLNEKLSLLGLNSKEADIYLALLKQGTLGPLELSRQTGINRTTIYRLLERLRSLGLCEEITDQYSTKARAVEPKQLELLLATKEVEIESLKTGLPQIISQLSAIKDTPSSSTTIKYFRGKSGLEQLLWNTLNAEGKNEVVGYGYGDWNESVGKKFAEKLRQEYVDRKIISKEISNQTHKNFTSVDSYLDKYWQGRYFSKSKLEFNHDTYIYNDVFAFHHFYQGELFGIEIHNAEIAKTQKQIFYLLWKQAKKK